MGVAHVIERLWWGNVPTISALTLSSLFIGGKTEANRQQVICARLISYYQDRVGFEHQSPKFVEFSCNLKQSPFLEKVSFWRLPGKTGGSRQQCAHPVTDLNLGAPLTACKGGGHKNLSCSLSLSTLSVNQAFSLSSKPKCHKSDLGRKQIKIWFGKGSQNSSLSTTLLL